MEEKEKEKGKALKETEGTKAKRVRSPNFPIIALDKAIELSKKLYEKFVRTAVPLPVAMEHLGYASKSSGALQTSASLSYYGLITTEGSGDKRRIKISDLSFTIIKDPDPNKRDLAIKSAALRPSIFRKTLEKYSGIPEKSIFAFDLEKEGKFNLKSIQDFINIFTDTITFAKISESDIIRKNDDEPIEQNYEEIGDKKMVTTETKPDQIRRGPGKERQIADYPVGRGLKARIIVSGESLITLESIEKLIKLLELNKEDLPELEPEEKREPSEN